MQRMQRTEKVEHRAWQAVARKLKTEGSKYKEKPGCAGNRVSPPDWQDGFV